MTVIYRGIKILPHIGPLPSPVAEMIGLMLHKRYRSITLLERQEVDQRLAELEFELEETNDRPR